ncbi:MAG TPA: hypothetical protein PKN33_03580 [Phycisphaerae bacterium]|nr:hypothetical protein [Phycisphaerae bacterium]
MTHNETTKRTTKGLTRLNGRNRGVAVLIGAAALTVSLGGCVANRSTGAFAPTNMVSDAEPGDLADIQTRLRRMVPGDVLDDLYFAMQQSPFDRATLAVALKTSQTLADDLKLQQHDAGRVSEQSRRRALVWLKQAVTQVGQQDHAKPPSFNSTNWSQWLAGAGDGDGEPASVFAFVDRVRADGNGSRFGDFDLVVSTGQSVYPVVSGAGALAVGGPSLHQYAQALDIGLIPVDVGQAQLANAGGSTIRPMSLRDALSRSTVGGAISDVVDSETWGAMIARRALARGASKQPTYHAIGITTPTGERSTLASRARAAMWVQAIDGQRLGLVEGWRDATVGGGSAYPSRLADPDWLEAVAHTSMEISLHGALLQPFRYERKLAVLIDAAAIDPQDPNAWSAEFTKLADALVDWQVPFDVVASSGGSNPAYEYKMRFKPGKDFSASAAAEEASKLLTKHAPELREVIFSESDGQPAARLYVRQSADGRRLAVVNLSDMKRSLKLLTSAGKSASAAYTDRLTGKSVRGSLAMEPFGVHILERK